MTAYRDGQVVAAAWGWSAGARSSWPTSRWPREHRGQGIGRHLLAAVEALAARRRLPVVGALGARPGRRRGPAGGGGVPDAAAGG